MKIILKRNVIGTIKEFEDKAELFEFVQKDIESTIYSDYREKRKWQILNTDNMNKFTINELIEMIDYRK